MTGDRRSTGRRRVIQAALRRLGLHTRTIQVVEELSRLGISVDEDQIEEAKFDLIKAPEEIRRRLCDIPRQDLRQVIRSPRRHGHRG